MNIRRAVSLMELLVVMSACTVILTLSATMMHRVMRAQSKARAFLNVERSAQRLSQQFRQDVQQARSAQVPPVDLPEGVLLRLQLSDSQIIDYREENGVVQRTLSKEEAVVAREEFAFHPEILVTASQQASPKLINLTITAPEPDESNPVRGIPEKPVNLQLQARLGSDFRFAQTPLERKGDE